MNTSSQTPTASASLAALLGLLSAACIIPDFDPADDWGETSSGDESGFTTSGDEGEGDEGGDEGGDGDANAFPDPEAWYRLKTQFQGATKCLESNDPSYDWHHGTAFLDECSELYGQFWRFEPVESEGETWYRMKSLFQGDNRCLEGNDPSSDYMNGAAFMAECQNNPDQLWKVVAHGDWINLETQLQGEGMCLDGNEADAPYKYGAAFMGQCQPFTGQNFQITTTDHYAPELCAPLGQPTSYGDFEGSFCTFTCVADDQCPPGPEGTAGRCDLHDSGTSYCGLYCNPLNDKCPVGSRCESVFGEPTTGLCLY